MKLRGYQQEAHDAVIEKWGEFDKLLLNLPTGTGKTIVFSKIIETVVQRGGGRCLVLAHRDELIRQAQDKLKISTGLDSAIEKADESAWGSLYPVTIGSVQSLMREKRRAKFSRDHYRYIIVDEAHHCLAASYQIVLNYFDGAKVLGVTATPDRGDKRDLGQYFDAMAYEYSLTAAIHDEWLVPIQAQTLPLKIDLSHCKIMAGDFSDKDLGSVLDPYLEQIAQKMQEQVSDRKTVVFLPLIATSKKLESFLRKAGLQVRHIDGTSKDRKEVLQWFRNAPAGSVLCNSMLLTEGWDEPSADCIVCLRPTKIRALYTQIVGRGTRLFEGKKNLLLLDFLWLSERHQLCHPSHLFAETEELAERMTKKQECCGYTADLKELLEEAKNEALNERENALAEELASHRRKKAKLINPIAWALETHDEQLEFYEPTFKWQQKKPTKRQLELLGNRGFDVNAVKDKGHASLLIDSVIKRSDINLATPKQVKLMAKFGVKDARSVTFQNARTIIDRIAANGWRAL